MEVARGKYQYDSVRHVAITSQLPTLWEISALKSVRIHFYSKLIQLLYRYLFTSN